MSVAAISCSRPVIFPVPALLFPTEVQVLRAFPGLLHLGRPRLQGFTGGPGLGCTPSLRHDNQELAAFAVADAAGDGIVQKMRCPFLRNMPMAIQLLALPH
jgi:hypothetical protein